jgi:hypothetical protein
MTDSILECLLELLASFLWWIIAFPFVLIISTPFILLFSLNGKPEEYGKRVRNGYRLIYEFWMEWGIFIIP